jgi:metal-responsive CopG/Arc/MetJ family transcriptional regulator
MLMPTERPKLIFVADKELEERIDTYWHENRLKNRSEAIRKLLDDALKRYEKKSK